MRVDLHYGGVNPIDRYNAEGQVNPDAPRPRTLGGEAAGEVDGRLVLVAGEGLGFVRDGVWSQAAVVPREAVFDVPDGVAAEHAAAMGIAGLTALNCVRTLARVTADDRVLVLGASGGVGSMIVSLAHAAGATVWGQTGSEAKVSAITAEGADRVLVGGPQEIAAGTGGLRADGRLRRARRRVRGLGGGGDGPARADREPRRLGGRRCHLQHAAAVPQDAHRCSATAARSSPGRSAVRASWPRWRRCAQAS